MTTNAKYWNPELETMPWKDVERWQLAQLASALPGLRQRSSMYAELHQALPADTPLRDLSDLQRVPFTYKSHIRDAQDASTTAAPLGRNQGVATKELVQFIASSGTTGQPLYYGLTAADIDRFSDAIANTWYTAGLRADDVVAHLVGLPMVAGGLPYADGFRRVGATLCWLGGFPTERILREMRRLRVSALLSTTSFGLYLSEQWEEVGRQTRLPSALRLVMGGGEPGLNQPEIRSRIRHGLGISQLRETMGLGDVLSSMWSECDAEDGMHFNAQRYVSIELIDPETGEQKAWSEGVTGELVYTTFARDATPVIRYRSRDHVQVTGMRCACGRSSPRIRCIGRTDDMLIYKGMNVFPTAIRDLIATRFAQQVEPMLRLWKTNPDQVRFDHPIEADIESTIVLGKEQAGILAQAIEDEVRSQLQIRLSVQVLEPGSLPKSTYKTSLIAVRPGPDASQEKA